MDAAKSVVIEAPVVEAFARVSNYHKPNAVPQYMSVKDAYEAEVALGDPEALHHCPLCGDTLPTAAFVRHAPECILVRATPGKVWIPPDRFWLPPGRE